MLDMSANSVLRCQTLHWSAAFDLRNEGRRDLGPRRSEGLLCLCTGARVIIRVIQTQPQGVESQSTGQSASSHAPTPLWADKWDGCLESMISRAEVRVNSGQRNKKILTNNFHMAQNTIAFFFIYQKPLLYSIGDAAVTGILDVSVAHVSSNLRKGGYHPPGVFAQSASHRQARRGQLASRLARLPILPPLCDLLLRDIQVEDALLGIDGDNIVILDQPDGTANGSLGDDVTDQETVGAAREAAVGDQSA